MQTNSNPVPIEALVERYMDRLYRFAYRLCGRTSDAEDLVQETFLIAHRKLHQLREERAALVWLLRILRSCWSRQCKRPHPLTGVELEDVGAEVPEPLLAEEVSAERLGALLEQMPEDYRQPLLLFYFRHLRYREIADILECPIGTVMSRIARGKAFLRSRLVPQEADNNRQ